MDNGKDPAKFREEKPLLGTAKPWEIAMGIFRGHEAIRGFV